MSEKRRLAIYGGSFSPPHMGHVLSARAYLDATGAGQIVIVPAKCPPHKSLDGGASDSDRLAMCELAFLNDPDLCGRCKVSDFELLRDAVSYTYDTVMHYFREGYEDISLLIGTDMLLSFETWYRFRDLFELVTLYYADRYDDKDDTDENTIRRFRREYGARILPLNIPPFEISSSRIRDIITAGGSLDGLVPLNVAKYIFENRLYKQK